MESDVLVGRTLAGITDREGFSIEDWPNIDEGALSAQAFERYKK